MNTKHISFAALAIVAVLAACTKNPIETPSDSNRFADLELASVNSVQTKAAIDGTTFPTDGEIGLFLFKDETATQAYGDGYENIKYTYNSTKEKWTASPSIKVGSTPGYLYGYYPYSSTATDIKAIPVASSLNGDDVMYAEKVSNVTDATASQTAITMNHALARVSITVKNNGYTGKAELSKIKFYGAEIAPTGTLNAIDGTISATRTDDVTLDVPTAHQTITAAGTTYECLLVPSEAETNKQTVALTLKIDGQDKTATLSGDNGVIIAQNTKSNITITLSNSGISVQTVSVEDWNVVEIGGYKVTVKMDKDVTAHDVLIDAYIEGDDVIVNAWSKSGQHLKCTMSDGEFCTSQSKNDKLAYTFTISDITENTTATIGYAKAVSSITVSPANAGCNVTVKEGDLYEGEFVRLVPEAAYSYGISCWKDQNDNLLSDGYDYIVRLSQDLKITACFEENLILGGEFSVKDDKGNVKKVRFTRGNLYLYYDGSSKVEQHQYDYNSSQWTSNTAHVSHFMWCNNFFNATSKLYNTSWDGQTPFFANDNNFTVNGFSEGKCFALSDWEYLLNTREASTVSGTQNARYFKGCIQKKDGTSMNGMFIFPDVFTWPSSVKTLPDEINEASSGYDNTYTYNDFKRLQDAGIVFLPAAGFRIGKDGNTNVEYAGSLGFYWSASPFLSSLAYGLYFDSGSVNPSLYVDRSWAYSVRLVTESK